MPETDTNDGAAVLLALGERLVWFETDAFGHPTLCCSIDGNLTYGIFVEPSDNKHTVAYREERVKVGSLAQGKAACEIHGATGKWEL